MKPNMMEQPLQGPVKSCNCNYAANVKGTKQQSYVCQKNQKASIFTNLYLLISLWFATVRQGVCRTHKIGPFTSNLFPSELPLLCVIFCHKCYLLRSESLVSTDDHRDEAAYGNSGLFVMLTIVVIAYSAAFLSRPLTAKQPRRDRGGKNG